MITSFLSVIIYIAILCVLVWGLLAILGAVGVAIPAPVKTVLYVILTILCLVVLLNWVSGGAPLGRRLL